MEHLPPVGWADVATKRDLDALEQRLDHRFETIEHRFETMDHRFESLEERIDLRSEALENKLLAAVSAVAFTAAGLS